MASRPRNIRSKLPKGIKPSALPQYVYWQPDGQGRWIYRPRIAGRLSTPIRLGGGDLTITEIWAAYEAVSGAAKPALTLALLIAQFQESQDWAALKRSTRDSYQACIDQLLRTRDANGVSLGDTDPDSWTPGQITLYADQRSRTSKTRAAHELRFLSRVFSWGLARELVSKNPVRDAAKPKLEARQRYVSEREYEAFLAYVSDQGRYPYLVPAAEIAYLCRLRLAEVLDLKREHCLPDGLLCIRRKGSKDAITEWSPRLRAAVDSALSLHGPIASMWLLPGRSRGRMDEGTFKAGWGNMQRAWAALGNPRFRFHDLKRAGVSDFDGDKLAASGHLSPAMLRIYDVLPSRVKATR